MSEVEWWAAGSGELWENLDNRINLRAGRLTFEGNEYGHSPIVTPLDMVIEREWLDHAACAGDPDLFDLFEVAAESYAKDSGPVVGAARAVCAECPVSDECLQDALESEDRDHQYRWGVRGGLTPRERAAVWSKQQAV